MPSSSRIKPPYGTPPSPLGLGALGVWSAHAGYSTAVPCAGRKGADSDGTLNGAGATRVSGAFGRCLNFDGSTGYMAASPSAGLKANGTWNPFQGTVVVWFRTSATPSNTWITGRISGVSGANSGLYLFLGAGANIRFIIASSGPGSVEADVDSLATGYNDGNWHMAAATFIQANSSTQRLYVDGIFQGSATTGTGNWAFGSNTIRWGISTDTFWGKFNGDMEPGAWFDRELSAVEVATLWKDGPAAFYRRPMPAPYVKAVTPATFAQDPAALLPCM